MINQENNLKLGAKKSRAGFLYSSALVFTLVLGYSFSSQAAVTEARFGSETVYDAFGWGWEVPVIYTNGNRNCRIRIYSDHVQVVKQSNYFLTTRPRRDNSFIEYVNHIRQHHRTHRNLYELEGVLWERWQDKMDSVPLGTREYSPENQEARRAEIDYNRVQYIIEKVEKFCS